MLIYYRISDGSYKKERLECATKEKCLKNFIHNVFNQHLDKLFIYADNVKDETYENIKEWVRGYNIEKEIIRSNAGSSAASFKLVFDEALKQKEDEIILFQEDDYIYLPNSRQKIVEGLERADYCTLYLHNDRFIPAKSGGNAFVSEVGSFDTRVFKTKSSLWCQVESTTMTFVTTTKILKEDAEIWHKHTTGTYPRDFDAWLELGRKGRTLVCTIPGNSTHSEKMWLSPLIDWEKVI